MSKKNEYYIDPERYLELKHFCKQYRHNSEMYMMMQLYIRTKNYDFYGGRLRQIGFTDPTASSFELANEYRNKNDLILKCCRDALNNDCEIIPFLLEGVTEDLGYEALKMRGIPCGKDYYYNAYHKFFYILDKARK
jgi:hypothetical protein